MQGLQKNRCKTLKNPRKTNKIIVHSKVEMMGYLTMYKSKKSIFLSKIPFILGVGALKRMY